MVLNGIPNSSKGTPLWRRLAWIAVCIAAFAFSQTMFLIGTFVSWWLDLAFAGAIAGSVTWLLVTSPRDRASTERFILTSAGIARVPTKARPGEHRGTILIPLAACTSVRLERIGPFWRRLRMSEPDPKHPRVSRIIFDAGIRCPDAVADSVLSALYAVTPLAAARAHPPTRPQASPGSPQPPPLP